jgi:hypothetical protein
LSSGNLADNEESYVLQQNNEINNEEPNVLRDVDVISPPPFIPPAEFQDFSPITPATENRQMPVLSIQRPSISSPRVVQPISGEYFI